MASYSKIIQIGNIVHDLKSKDVGGKTCLTFALATNFKYGDKEDSCFIDVTFWEKSAENIMKYFKKGDPILVEGELRQEKWEDKTTGDKRSKHVIRGTSWGFLPGARTGEQGGSAPAQASTAQAQASSTAPTGYPDDIPF